MVLVNDCFCSIKCNKIIYSLFTVFTFLFCDWSITQRRYRSLQSIKLTGATLGQMGILFGSYIGFKREVNTSGLLRYDHKLVVFLGSFKASRSASQLPRNVPEMTEIIIMTASALNYF